MRGITGRVAAIKWAYYTAATIEGYTVSKDAAGWTVIGALVPGTVDAFKLTQRPLYFVAPFRGGAWRWEILGMDDLGSGRFRARLGPMMTDGKHGITAH